MLKARRDAIVSDPFDDLPTCIKTERSRGAVPGTVLGQVYRKLSVGKRKKRKVGGACCGQLHHLCGDCWFCRKVSTTVRMAAGNSAAGSTAAKRICPRAICGYRAYPNPRPCDRRQCVILEIFYPAGIFGAELAFSRDKFAMIGAGPVGLCAAMCGFVGARCHPCWTLTRTG